MNLKKKIVLLISIIFLGNSFFVSYANDTQKKEIVINKKQLEDIKQTFFEKNIKNKIKKMDIQGKRPSYIDIVIQGDNNNFKLSFPTKAYNSLGDIILYFKNNKNNSILKEKIISIWNNNTIHIARILKGKDIQKCIDINSVFTNLDITNFLYSDYVRNNKKINISIGLSEDDIGNLIACHYSEIFPEYVNFTKLETRYIPYRYKNITEVVNQDFTLIVSPGQKVSLVDLVLRNPIYKYVVGTAIEDGEVINIEAGGVCGISTIFYRAILNAYQDYKIIKRRPHSAWYDYLYGKIKGIDATIYDAKGKIDFVFQNNTNLNHIIIGFNKKDKKYSFDYGLKIYYPYMQKSYVKQGKVTYKNTNETIKKDGKDVKGTYKWVLNYIYSKNDNTLLGKINSCYKFMNESF